MFDHPIVEPFDLNAYQTIGITVHGAFNGGGFGGEGSTDLIGPYLKDQHILHKQLDYGFRMALGAKWGNQRVSRELVNFLQSVKTFHPKVIVYGHSNGAAIMHQASLMPEFPSNMDIYYVYLNPALDVDRAPSNRVKGVDVWYSPYDKVVRLSDLIDKITGGLIIPKHWGSMGKYGYQGSDQRVHNYDYNEVFYNNVSQCHELVFGHSTVFSVPKSMMPLIVAQSIKNLDNVLSKEHRHA